MFLLVRLRHGLAKQVLAGHVQQLRSLVLRLLPPPLKGSGRNDVSRHARIVELENIVFVGNQLRLARALRHRLNLLEQPAVFAVKRLLGIPFALHQRVTDEQFAAEPSIDARELHSSVGDDSHTKQGHALVGDYRTLVLLPVRFAVGSLA